MMALNIAVPLSSVGDMMDGFGLLSPISPLSVDCRGVATVGGTHGGKKQLVSPVGSESSGVSSLDSDEIKKPTSPPTTPTEEVERPTSSSPIPLSLTSASDAAIVHNSSAKTSSCSSTRSSLSSTDSISSSSSSSSSSSEESGSSDESVEPESEPEQPAKEVKVMLGGRNVLDLIDNLTTPSHFRLQFAQLPENDNIHFFLDNRSQYHRLGANGHIQEYTMVKCKCCDFRYPVNGTSLTSAGPKVSMGQTNLTAAFPQQQQQLQQQQQQQLKWANYTINYNSIANSRDKLSLNVAANAFNKTLGGGNNSNNSNNGSSTNSGSQYFRNGNMAAGLFGRDSNRNSGSNFLSSTSTYNNHKSYQQSFGAPNNTSNNSNSSKFNTPYSSYQLQQQQQQQQQQQFYPKNHPMRYGSGNGAGTGQSSGSGGFNASAAVVAAAALASQNLLNFNGFNNSASFNGKNNSNSNMFAYYKTIM